MFTWENLDNAAGAYNKLVAKIASLLNNTDAVDNAQKDELLKPFTEAMDNDLNTALAITAVYDALKSDANAATKLAAVEAMDQVLSLGLMDAAKASAEKAENTEIPAEVLVLVEARKEARKAKDFAKADELRDQITALGWQIRETRQGTEITPLQ